MFIRFEGGDGAKNPEVFYDKTKIPVTFTYDDGTSETIEYSKSEPVTVNYDDGTSETITLQELADAFDNAETDDAVSA